MYRKDVEAILGIPDAMRDEVAKYQEWYTRPLTAEEQDDVRAYRWHPEGLDYSKLVAEETILVQIEYQDSIVQSFYVSRFTGL